MNNPNAKQVILETWYNIEGKNFKKTFLDFKEGVKSIQTAGYNNPSMVYDILGNVNLTS